MLGRVIPVSIGLPLITLVLVNASAAHAQSLGACGQIQLEAEAECEVQGGVSCEGMCTPLSVRAACAGKLTASCDAECKDLPSFDCQAECKGECMGGCTANPGRFDCAGSCQVDCSGTCAARCEASPNRAQCAASCEATCGASCQGKCDVSPPEASCDVKCEASCEGSCTADANIDCQVDCQAELYGSCEVELEGGCQVACETEKGALFCDGSYVDHGDNLAMCVAAIEAAFDVQVDGYAQGSSSCSGGKCQAEGEAGVSCSVRPGANRADGAWLALVGVASLVARRRRSVRIVTTSGR